MNNWQPQNLTETCMSYSAITTCQPSTFMFLQLITSLFGSPIPEEDQARKLRDRTVFNGLGGLKFAPNPSEEIVREVDSEYDFIVVGAGSAGCLLANRLSEVQDWKVLLLEAGGEEPRVADVPAFAPALQRSTIDWNYMTMPQPRSCLARRNGRCAWPRGRVMGGTSGINYMIYLRGGPKDYDDWASFGNEGWSYQDVLPYFIKTEDNRNLDKVARGFHGRGGEWTVEYFKYQDKNVYALLDSISELGYSIYDQNAIAQIGASLIQHSSRNGQRLSSNVAFIRPIRNRRRNLTVRPNSYVTRVLINPLTKTAYGVEFMSKGLIRRVKARKEVILTSGVFNSAKLLMLSGVGPRSHLQELGIKVIKDLPVGHNLHDHTTIDGVVLALSNITATTASSEQIQQDISYWQQSQSGPLSSTGCLQVNWYVRTSFETDLERADIQYSLDASNVENFYTDPILTTETSVTPNAYYDGITIRPIILNPRSRGVVELNRTDPVFGDPLIYANTFEDLVDLQSIIEAIRIALPIEDTPTMQKIGARIVRIPLPACVQHEFNTDDYWACVAMNYTLTMYHPVGTNKMGPEGDPTAVVSPELKVHGIKHLRVVDSSIMPRVVRGNTNTATLMIAEKGSDMIKQDWLQGRSFVKFPKFSDIFYQVEKMCKKFLNNLF